MKSLNRNNKYAIKIDRLTFGYLKTEACFSSADLLLEKGEKAVLLSGKNMGKSTLCRIISVIEQNYIGLVELLGYNSNNLRNAYKNLVFIPENPVFLESKSVHDNIKYAMSVLYDNSSNMDYILKVPYSLERIAGVKAKKLSVVDRTLLEIERSKLKNIKLLVVDRSVSDIKKQISIRKENETTALKTLKEMYRELIDISESALITCETKEDIAFYGMENSPVLYVYLGKVYRFASLDDFENNIIELDGLKYLISYNTKLLKLEFSGGKYYFYETVVGSKSEFLKLVVENIKKRKILDKNMKKYMQNGTFEEENTKIKKLYTRKIDLSKYPKLLDKIIKNNLELEEFFVISSKIEGKKKSFDLSSERFMLFVESTGERVV